MVMVFFESVKGLMAVLKTKVWFRLPSGLSRTMGRTGWSL